LNNELTRCARPVPKDGWLLVASGNSEVVRPFPFTIYEIALDSQQRNVFYIPRISYLAYKQGLHYRSAGVPELRRGETMNVRTNTTTLNTFFNVMHTALAGNSCVAAAAEGQHYASIHDKLKSLFVRVGRASLARASTVWLNTCVITAFGIPRRNKRLMPDAISIYASLITGPCCCNAKVTISAGRFGSENGWFRSMVKFYGPRISGVTGTALLVLTAWQFELRSVANASLQN